MKKRIKKLISILTITTLLFTQVVSVSAFEIPTPPPTPTLQSTPPPTPSEPTPPPEPVTPTLENFLTPSPTPTPEETNTTKETESSETETLSTSNDSTQPLTENSSKDNISPETTSVPSGPEANGYVGDTTLDTGNATTTGNITTSANENLSSTNPSDPTEDGTSVENSGNGSDSDNSATVADTSSIDTIQDNNAQGVNDLTLDSNTGNSSASKNTGGDTTINTGDANTSGTVVTQLNSNLAGVTVSEFNVVDDQLGDLLLDFAGSCIIGCEAFSDALVQNTGNGSESTNSANLTQDVTNNTFQNNDATLENDLLLTSNSGENSADKNTGGDTTIQTGDANTSANVLSFLNNNVAGNVVMGVVNIFGDLIGDIILPELPGGNSSLAASNIGNGSDSTNAANIDQTSNSETFQTNDAEIINDLNLQATTGDNQTSKNTGGNTSIETGNADVVAQVLNIANSNISSGNWWLVLVNEAGEWAGRILGAPDGSNFAGSEGTQFSVNPNGDITASNIGNGSGSTNDASLNQSNSTTTVQSNVARILNNINLFANTGGNSANSNTGGNTSITTGDASVVANLVNFVNNNIVGSGKLTVVTVNVFGRWVGDFLSPGQTKQKVAENNTTQDTTNNNIQDNPTTTTTSSNPPSQNNNSTNSTPQAQTTTPIATPPANSTVAASHAIAQTVAQIVEPLETQVAGIKVLASNELADAQNKTLGKKKFKINLAWGLLLLPLLAGMITLRKYYTYKKGLGN